MLRVPASARRAAAALLGAAGLVLFGWLLESVAGNWSLADLDWPILDGLASHRNGLVTAVASAVSAATAPGPVVGTAGAAAVVWAVWRREFWRPALLVGACSADLLLICGARYWVGRARPPAWFEAVGSTDGPAFPSAHTAGAATLLFVGLYLLYARRRSLHGFGTGVAGASVLVLAVAASDLYLGRHWLTDVAASAAVGALVLAAVVWIDAIRAPGPGAARAAVARSEAAADT
jgi:undecaprenyl-diphosphatase